VRAAPAIALFCCLLTGCDSSREFVVVGVHAVPSQARRLLVRVALDGKPATAPQTFTSGGFGSDTSFALAFGTTAAGRLALELEAWDDATPPCAYAWEGADVAVGNARLDVTLRAITPPDCSGKFARTPGMVTVPAGAFQMGCDPTTETNCMTDEALHTVTLSAFEIDRTEVSIAAYQACVTDGKCDTAFMLGSPQTAQSSLTWDQATKYCEARGKTFRLPTEAEWEKAARGTDGRRYPWGNTPAPDCAHANFSGCGHPDGEQPIGGHPDGASAYGALDMAGNVEEWVADWYQVDYDLVTLTDPSGPATCPDPSLGCFRVTRGGMWSSQPGDLLVYRRSINDPTIGLPGVRCVHPL
jgi:formylglycine-generating enzyme required for sulfatase activity